MVWRPFYFAKLIVDPKDANRLYKTDGYLIMSEDGGKSFSNIGGFAGMHGDVHDVFIEASNPKHVFAGDDGGLWISYDGANKWWKSDNLPISQFYHVSLDNADPYHVYGGLQDNSSWVGDSAYPGGITSSRWKTCSTATASGCSPIPPILTTCLPNTRVAASAASTCVPTRHGTSSRGSVRTISSATPSCGLTGTPQLRCPRMSRARFTSARSFCSARATTVRAGSGSRRT